jgi:hypothetical protein
VYIDVGYDRNGKVVYIDVEEQWSLIHCVPLSKRDPSESFVTAVGAE